MLVIQVSICVYLDGGGEMHAAPCHYCMKSDIVAPCATPLYVAIDSAAIDHDDLLAIFNQGHLSASSPS